MNRLGVLRGRIAELQAEIRANKRDLDGTVQRRDEIVAGVHDQIEEFVTAAAFVAANEVGPPPEPDPELLEHLVYWKWRGVETVEKAREELLGEIRHRSGQCAFDQELGKVPEKDRPGVGARVLKRLRHEYTKAHPEKPEPEEPETVEFGPLRPYSDHLLMRHGRAGWERTYALGATDDEVAKLVMSTGMNGDESAIALFSAKWAIHAFQRLMTSHTFAAALMCSDVQREVLEGIEKQWDAFMVVVPNGMLVADGQEVSRLLVVTYSFWSQLILLSVQANDQVKAISNEAATLSELLVSEEGDLKLETQSKRCILMAKRLVAGLLLNLQHPPNYKIRKVEARSKSLRRQAEPEHRIVTIGKPLEIDCRATVKEFIEHGPKKGRKHTAPTVQVMVRGHYTHQPYGPRSSLRRVQWIEPFWRGPEAALIQTRGKKVS